jgi:hypothetical protein
MTLPKTLSFFLLLLAVASGTFLTLTFLGFSREKSNTEELQAHTHAVHLHAGFRIFFDGEWQDFSADEYMYVSACGIAHDAIATLADSVHLHDRVEDVVHVHEEGILWSDLFEYLEIATSTRESMVGFALGEGEDVLRPVATTSLITNHTSVIFTTEVDHTSDTLGESEGALAAFSPTDFVSFEHIHTVEKSKESCGGGS